MFLTDTISTHSTPHLDDFANDDIDSYMIAMETTVGSEGSRTLPSISPSPGLQLPCNSGPHSEEDDEAEPSTVPGTPPPKKVGAEGGGRKWEARREQPPELTQLPILPVPFAVLWLHPEPGALPQPRAG